MFSAASEDTLRALLESAADFIMVLDEQARYLHVGPTVERLLGWKQEELIGKSSMEHVHPDDAARVLPLFQECIHHSGDSSKSVVYRRLAKDGSWRWMEATGRNLLHDPDVRGVVILARDITDRKRAEDALSAQDALTRSVFESSPDCVKILDLDGRILSMNRNGLRLMEIESFESVFEANWATFWDTGARMQVLHALDEARAGRTARFEASAPTHGGTPKWWDVTVSPVEGPQGRVERLLAVSRDVTNRHHADEALRHSEARFRAITGNSYDLITTFDAQGKRLYTSPSIGRILGYTIEEVLGQNVFDIIHPDDRESTVRLLRHGVEAGHGYEARARYRVRHKDGHWVHLDSVAKNLIGEPGVDAIVLHARDVTEAVRLEESLRESERRFRMLVENSQDIITELDAHGRIVYESPSLTRITGFQIEELIGQYAPSFIHPEDRALAESEIARMVADASAMHPTRFRFRHKEGRWIHLEITARALSVDGSVRGIAIHSRDVSDRVASEQALEQSEERYRLLVEGSEHIFFYQHDTDGRFTYLSPSVVNALGFEPHDIEGKNFRDLHFADDDNRALAEDITAHEIATGEKPAPYTVRLRRADGEERIFEIVEAPAHQENGRLIVQGFARDVTDRERARSELQEAQRLQETILNSIPDAAFLKDRDGRYLAFNETAARMMGRTVEEARGRVDEDLFPEEHCKIFRESDAQVLRNGPIRFTEIVPSPLTGEDRWHETIKVPTYDAEGNKTGIVGIARDITERVRLEQNLRASEQQLRIVFENTAIGILIADMNTGAPVSANPALQRMLGYTEAEILQIGVEGITHPDDFSTDLELFQEILAGIRDSYTIEKRYIHKNGTVIWGALTVSVARDEDGNPIQLIGMARDITRRKNAEIALRKNEEQFRALFETSRAVKLLARPGTGEIVTANPAAAAFYGYSVHQLTRMRITDLNRMTDTEFARRSLDMAKSATGMQVRVDHYLASGETRHVEVYVTPVQVNGEVLLQSTVVDITDIARAEETLRAVQERFRAMVENSADIITLSDAQGARLYISDSVTQVLGWTPQELIGTNTFSLIHPDDHESVLATFQAGVKQPGFMTTMEYRTRHKDGSWRHMEATARNMLHDPAVRAIIINARDITARKQAEDKVVEIEGKMKYLALHDPLTGMYNNLGLVAAGDMILERARQLRNPTGIIRVRLDNLGEINQQQNAQRGDAALQALADIIRGTYKRGTDFVARTEGDTFTIIEMARTTMVLQNSVRRLTEALQMWNDTHPGLPLRVSVGFAGTEHKVNRNLRSLIELAEKKRSETATS